MIHEQQPLFSRETWLFFGMWLLSSCAKPTRNCQSLCQDLAWTNQSTMHSNTYKILLDSMEQASFFTSLHMFCSLQSIVLAPPSFRKFWSMSKCPDSQNITTESVGKCSASKRCDPAQSCTWWTCLAINPASNLLFWWTFVHCDSIKLKFWTFPVQQHYHFLNEFFHTVCWSLLSKPSGDSHQCQQPRLYRPRSFGIMLYTSWK